MINPKHKKTAIYLGITALAVGYLMYVRKRNKEEAAAILEYINVMPIQNDASASTKQGMDAVRGTKIDMNKLSIGNLKGAYSNPAIKNAIAKVVVNLYSTMKGGGTDVKVFAQALSSIKNKNTLAFVDKVYASMYKQGLFEAMKGEAVLNNIQYGQFSDKTKNDLAIPFYSEGYWNPSLAKYFNNLPIY